MKNKFASILLTFLIAVGFASGAANAATFAWTFTGNVPAGLTPNDLHITFTGTGGSIANIVVAPAPMNVTLTGSRIDIVWANNLAANTLVTIRFRTDVGPVSPTTWYWTKNGAQIGATDAGSWTTTGGQIILNEYNAVGPEERIEECDEFWPDVDGNGGNWIELMVTADGTNIQGWTIEWKELNDFDDSGDDVIGTITFTNDSRWNNLPAGTIITIRERPETGNPPTHGPVVYISGDGEENPDTDSNDWWIGVYLDDDDYVTHAGAGFLTSNDNWMCRIISSGSVEMQEWVGEGAEPGYIGTGVNNVENCELQITVSPSTTPAQIVAGYSDSDSSSFGSFNFYDSGVSNQNMTPLRGTHSDYWRDDVTEGGFDC